MKAQVLLGLLVCLTIARGGFAPTPRRATCWPRRAARNGVNAGVNGGVNGDRSRLPFYHMAVANHVVVLLPACDMRNRQSLHKSP